jgi:hypothetical protein
MKHSLEARKLREIKMSKTLSRVSVRSDNPKIDPTKHAMDILSEGLCYKVTMGKRPCS